MRAAGARGGGGGWGRRVSESASQRASESAADYGASGSGWGRGFQRPRAREGEAERLVGAKSWDWSLGQAAAAIIAALSVDRARVGKATRRLRRAASAVKRRRSSRLAATPPVMRMRRTARDSAAAKVFFMRSPTTACWKLAMRSRVWGEQRASASAWVVGFFDSQVPEAGPGAPGKLLTDRLELPGAAGPVKRASRRDSASGRRLWSWT